MSRLGYLLALLALLFATATGETIVSDSIGNQVGLPIGGGNATGVITNAGTVVPTSPYTLSVFINDGNNGGTPGEVESFYINPPSNGERYGNATLIRTGFNANYNDHAINWNTTAGQYLGDSTHLNTAAGLYQYVFTIPVSSYVLVNLTYVNTGAPNPIVDLISVTIFNPIGIIGDPQFVGLRGQSFQVHGIDGAVYNIITEENTQVNSRFVFLSEGDCPVIDGKNDANCWSHPGSYIGAMSFQQRVGGKLHQVLVESGDAKSGFSTITLDGKQLSVGDSYNFGSFSVKFMSSHRVHVETENFSFDLANSDMFINQAVSAKIPLSKLTSHGLLGQTHAAKVYPTTVRYIAGDVDDYVIADNDIFGTDFAHNQF